MKPSASQISDADENYAHILHANLLQIEQLLIDN